MSSAHTATRHLGTRVSLVCGSFLAFAALTAFIGAHERQAESDTVVAGAPIVVDRVIAQNTQDGQSSAASVEQAQVPTPVTRSRGT